MKTLFPMQKGAASSAEPATGRDSCVFMYKKPSGADGKKGLFLVIMSLQKQGKMFSALQRAGRSA
jgi:hypothetical protein